MNQVFCKQQANPVIFLFQQLIGKANFDEIKVANALTG